MDSTNQTLSKILAELTDLKLKNTQLEAKVSSFGQKRQKESAGGKSSIGSSEGEVGVTDSETERDQEGLFINHKTD